MSFFWDRLVPFVRLLKVDPYMFLFMFSFMIKAVTITQLFQDKICLLELKREVEFCSNINRPEYVNDKDKVAILGQASTYQLYSTLISCIPGVFLSLFVGSWCDKHLVGRKVLMVIAAIGVSLETMGLLLCSIYSETSAPLTLLAFIPSAISGGMLSCFAAVYSYVSKNTPPEMRSIRYTVLELCFFLAAPIGAVVGGHVIEMTPWGGFDNIRNYVGVFAISLGAIVLALVWVIIVIDETQPETETKGLINRSTGDITPQEMDSLRESQSRQTQANGQGEKGCPTEGVTDSNQKWHQALGSLFDFDNVRKMFTTCFAKRPNKQRLQLWLSMVSMCCILVTYIGAGTITYQFSEKAFGWGPKQYSTISSSLSILSMGALMIGVPVLVKKLRVQDTMLVIIGVVSLYCKTVLMGTLQTPAGFVLSHLVGVLGGMSPVAIRTYISKIVSAKELSTAFSLLSTLESLTPLFASTIYTTIFRETLWLYPGLTFQLVAITLLLPLFVFVWIDVSYGALQ